MKSLGLLLPTWLRSLLGHCGAHGRLAGLLVAVPCRLHSASSIVANGFLGSWVLGAAVLAGGVLTGFARSGNVCLSSHPEHMGFFDFLTKIACPRALGLARLLLAVPAGPLARVPAAAVHCELFVF